MGGTDSRWPVVFPTCRNCGEGPPGRKHKNRGLCTYCYPGVLISKSLRRLFKKIPRELSNGKYESLLRNPRKYVSESYSGEYARQFGDDKILDEAKRIFDVTKRRWLGLEAFVEDPRPDVEDFAWSMSRSVASPSVDDGVVSVARIRGILSDEVQSFLSGVGAEAIAFVDAVIPTAALRYGKPVVVRDGPRWVIYWGPSTGFIAVTIPNGDEDLSDASLYTYNDGLFSQARPLLGVAEEVDHGT